MQKTFGDRIKERRTALKLTLEQLAQATNSSKSYVWELENKNPPRPSAEKLSAIARALDVTVDWLMGADDQTLDEAEDKAFYRSYSGLPTDPAANCVRWLKFSGPRRSLMEAVPLRPHKEAGRITQMLDAVLGADRFDRAPLTWRHSLSSILQRLRQTERSRKLSKLTYLGALMRLSAAKKSHENGRSCTTRVSRRGGGLHYRA